MSRRFRVLTTFTCIFLLVCWGISLAQLRDPREPTPGSNRLKWFDEHVRMMKDSFFKNLKWRFVGPQWMSGRISDIEVPLGQPYTFYVASGSGGLWKTTNEGTTWIELLGEYPSPTIGDIAIAPSNPNIIWVGTGEDMPCRSCYAGTGVYKSTDGGKTFSHMNLEDSHRIGRIIIHPENSDIVYVAVDGAQYSYNPQRGIYKTTDGGNTWDKILFVNEKTGFIDIAMDPTNPDILYTAAWERLRQAWNLWQAGPGSGIYKSTDGGINWEKLTNGLPNTGLEGRIGLAVSPSNPNVIYACLDNHGIFRKAKKGEIDAYGRQREDVIIGAEVYRSDDYGETWKKVNKDHLPWINRTYGYCWGEIRAHPRDKDTVWILGVSMMKSTDGGETFQFELGPGPAKGVHVDHHALWIDPENPDRMIDGNDGGINITYDGGQSWKDIKNLPVLQFFAINVDMAEPFNIVGTAQDHGCWMGPVTHNPDSDNPYEWKAIPGGEASYLAVDPTDPNILYSEGMYGSLSRTNLKTLERKRIKPQPKEGEEPLRCTWLAPFIISPHNPFTIYFGSQFLFRSLDRGDSWQTISPDLTDNDTRKRGDVPFGAISTISESPITPGLIWVGTDDGNVHVTTNGGVTLTKIKGLEDKWASRVEASHFNKDTAYVSLTGYREDDFKVYLYKVTDFGKMVTEIGSGIPGGPINVVKEDPKNENVLYVGTDTGVYISLDKGENWDALMAGMPTTFVHDLIVHPRDNILVAGTHGRGIFVMDVSPIQQYVGEVKDKDVHLFSTKPVYFRTGWEAYPQANIVYLLKNKGDVDMVITDKDGKTVWKGHTDGEKGFNQIAWNLRTKDPNTHRPRFAQPGHYTVRITADSHTSETTIELKRLN